MRVIFISNRHNYFIHHLINNRTDNSRQVNNLKLKKWYSLIDDNSIQATT